MRTVLVRSYVMAANLLTPDPDHAATVVRFALRAQQEAAKVLQPDADDGSTLQMRIGEPCQKRGGLKKRWLRPGNLSNRLVLVRSLLPPTLPPWLSNS